MQWGGLGSAGRICCRLASVFSPGYKGQVRLARITKNSFVSRQCVIAHSRVTLGNSVYLGVGVTIFGGKDAGEVHIDDKACLHKDTIIETAEGGSVRIGRDTHIQPRCQFSAQKGSILIGCDVQIAPECGFYPYNHGTALGTKMRDQPVRSEGDIVIGDDVWIGYGVIVLDNVTIGNGAVVAAGAVVRSNIPPFAIAAGVPARVVGLRE